MDDLCGPAAATLSEALAQSISNSALANDSYSTLTQSHPSLPKVIVITRKFEKPIIE